ncbi:MAG: helix-turn-helix domain-containing protein [Candidatus Pacebacteria bacterium]|nr:helix-turn-helix domain-containing protein [Candidatus Paceibacterota bacterium]
MKAAGGKSPRSVSAVKLPQPGGKGEGLTRILAQHLRSYFAAVDDPMKVQRLYPQIIEEVERVLIVQCLDIAQGNQLRAARILGLNRNTLRRKIDELGIDIAKYRE